MLSPRLLHSSRCRRSASLASAANESTPAWALSRTTLPGPLSVPASNPRGDGENRASASVNACVRPWANCVYKLGSFFSQRVCHLAQFLGHVKTVNHRFAVGQQDRTSLQERRTHVGVV